ncbi:MAG: alanine racemase [Ilumatobacteraceae bacterium]
MTIRLTVRTAMWRSHVARVASSIDGLVPVVKGNGYGFGRLALARIAAEFSDTIAVGTIDELDVLDVLGSTAVGTSTDVAVLTPTLTMPDSTAPILTVGHHAHIDALAGWNGRVVVKLASSMRRFGGDAHLIDAADAAGLEVVGVSIHPPLAGTSADHRDEIVRAIDDIDPAIPVWLSHIDPVDYAALPTALPTARRYRLRLGTALWHGDKSFLQLTADVIDVRPIASGDRAGYRLSSVPASGHLVMIGAGSAGGVAELAGGLSPFHFERTRLALHEPPHMHTSMAFVPDGDPLPSIGDRVDLQRPLITTAVDRFEWL